MNVYDFDGTIYAGDSSVDFFRFALQRHPAAARHLPAFALAAIRHAAGKCTTRELKEVYFHFLRDIPDVQREVQQFWVTHYRKIRPWYLDSKERTDVIISASPVFLLAPACRMLGVQMLIASQVDAYTGRFIGENCKGAEKVQRFRAACPGEQINRFYSDSVSDLPLAELAEQAFLIQKGFPVVWDTRKGARQ